ncbi:MAG: ATP-binding cassette domain-containing protein [Gemmatimonadales bacterium]|jgi:ATPase subunit of ABC transporter with duplicated ATPase domains|nr:ATP-binding cassette domain-containing protein [Gemmatimonadales bacterium]
MISVANLAKSYGDRTLFAGVSLQLNAGERYGLVGANGSGKTTLLRILGGDLEASEGIVSTPKRIRVGMLRQDQFAYDDHEILAVALMGNPELWNAMAEKEVLLAQQGGEFDAHRFAELEDAVLRHDGYAAEARAASILEGLGLPTSVHRRPLSTLSGGFRLRVLLAQVLASAPDVLLLDEPTNHLDILSIRWLETFLREFAGTVVVISHDHRFLDNVCTTILDVDYETVLPYPGNYGAFLEAKRAERERRMKDIDAREREIAHHQKFVDRFRAKASKARQAQSKLRMIEKQAESLEELPQSSRRYPTFRFEQRRPSGREVLTVRGIEKAFGDNAVLHGVDLAVTRGDRLAIMGPNGIGKSTLLKIAMGHLEADAGTVTWGYEAHPGYFAQDQREQFESADVTAEEWVWQFCANRDLGYVRGQMGLMLFTGDDGKKRLRALSGGEVSRLVFTRLGIDRSNVLVLDEPTNHLDLESIEALVEGLRAYPGTLIFVSHDRWFVSQLATRVLEIRPERIIDYPGTYEEYVHACGDDHLDVDRVVLKARKEQRRKTASEQRDRRRASDTRTSQLKKAQQRLDQVTAKIEAAESRVADIDATFCEPDYFVRTAVDEVRKLEEERTGLQREVADLLAEWERIEAEIGGLERDPA